MTIRPFALIALCCSTATLGCARSVELEYVATKETLDLSDELQRKLRDVLIARCGTPANPKLLGDDSFDSRRLRRGAAIYEQRCAACHGTSGDGNGPAAEYMYPRPRDYRKGIFKFTSTPYGARPRREDLLRTVRHGAKGTSMPAFGMLPDDELQAALDYVLALARRGELEILLFVAASNDDEITDEAVEEAIGEINDNWKRAREQAVFPLTKMPTYSPETVALGKKAFLTEEAGCFKCHGEDGRGRTTENVQGFKDVWGFQTRAADLTAGMFHGGKEPVDIYRRIYSGINGTPMPSFQMKLERQPETFWHLVHYVQFISSARRREVVAQQDAHRPQQRTTDGHGS